MTKHGDVAIGAVGRALPTTDAVIFDDDLFVPLSKDGVYGTTDEAIGIRARSAARRH